MLQYGSVLATRVERLGGKDKDQGELTALVAFNKEGLDPRLLNSREYIDENGINISYTERKLTIKEFIPHGFASQLTVGFAYKKNQTKFVPMSPLNENIMIKLSPLEKKFEIFFKLNDRDYKISSHISQIFTWYCKRTENGYEVYINFKKTPQILRMGKKEKFYEAWYINMHEPFWKRTGNVFEEFQDFLLFELKKFAVKFVIPNDKNFEIINTMLLKSVFPDM